MDPKSRRGSDLAERLARYAGEVLRVVGEIPDTKEGRHIKDQLTRSGTAPGAHYGEARSAQSPRDFIHKVSLASKEARESQHWLRASIHARYLQRDIDWLVREGGELTAILSASLQTARKNLKARSGS